jgi:membrane-associated protease RseP (regulator of RpoE activity)
MMMNTENIKKKMGVAFVAIVLACTALGVAGVWGAIKGDTAWQIFATLVVCAIGLGTSAAMMGHFFKAVAFIVILFSSQLAFAQEGWEDDLPIDAEVETYVDPLLTKVDELSEQVAALSVQLAAMKTAESCQCQCPTLDEIRTVVREELDRVTVTLKTAAGTVKKTELPISKVGATKEFALQPGDRVVAIDGVPVTPFTYQANERTVTQYATPRFDMRVTSQGNRIVGAVRQQTCRTVNGVRVCD